MLLDGANSRPWSSAFMRRRSVSRTSCGRRATAPSRCEYASSKPYAITSSSSASIAKMRRSQTGNAALLQKGAESDRSPARCSSDDRTGALGNARGVHPVIALAAAPSRGTPATRRPAPRPQATRRRRRRATPATRRPAPRPHRRGDERRGTAATRANGDLVHIGDAATSARNPSDATACTPSTSATRCCAEPHPRAPAALPSPTLRRLPRPCPPAHLLRPGRRPCRRAAPGGAHRS